MHQPNMFGHIAVFCLITLQDNIVVVAINLTLVRLFRTLQSHDKLELRQNPHPPQNHLHLVDWIAHASAICNHETACVFLTNCEKKATKYLKKTHFTKSMLALPPSFHVLCMLMPQIIPFFTLTLVHMWYEGSTPGVTSMLIVNMSNFLKCVSVCHMIFS